MLKPLSLAAAIALGLTTQANAFGFSPIVDMPSLWPEPGAFFQNRARDARPDRDAQRSA